MAAELEPFEAHNPSVRGHHGGDTSSGRALELNIGGTLRPWIPQSWREEGGPITFAGDAHTTDALAGNC